MLLLLLLLLLSIGLIIPAVMVTVLTALGIAAHVVLQLLTRVPGTAVVAVDQRHILPSPAILLTVRGVWEVIRIIPPSSSAAASDRPPTVCVPGLHKSEHSSRDRDRRDNYN